MTIKEKESKNEITNFFRVIFEKDNQGTAKECPLCSMKKPFTEEEEISMTSKKLRNGKSLAIGSMYTEYIKYSPGTTHQIIADILKERVERDDYLEIVKEGILTPLQKPQKKS